MDLPTLVTTGGGILHRAGAGVVLHSEFIETITKDPVKGGPHVSWKIRALPLLRRPGEVCLIQHNSLPLQTT